VDLLCWPPQNSTASDTENGSVTVKSQSSPPQLSEEALKAMEDSESAIYYPPALSRPAELMPPETVAPLKR